MPNHRDPSLQHILGDVQSSDDDSSSSSSSGSSESDSSDGDSSDEEIDLDATVATSSSSVASFHNSVASLPPRYSVTSGDAPKSPGRFHRSVFVPARTSLTNALVSPVRAAQRFSIARFGSPDGNGKKRSSERRSFLTSPLGNKNDSPGCGSPRRRSLLDNVGATVRRMSQQARNGDASDEANNPNHDSFVLDDGTELPTDGASRDEVLAALICKELEMI